MYGKLTHRWQARCKAQSGNSSSNSPTASAQSLTKGATAGHRADSSAKISAASFFTATRFSRNYEKHIFIVRGKMRKHCSENLSRRQVLQKVFRSVCRNVERLQ